MNATPSRPSDNPLRVVLRRLFGPLLGDERQRLRVAREARFRVYDEIRARNQDQRPEEIEDSIAQAVTAARQEKETQ